MNGDRRSVTRFLHCLHCGRWFHRLDAYFAHYRHTPDSQRPRPPVTP